MTIRVAAENICTTGDLPGVALVITFHDTFHKKVIESLDEGALLQILQHDCKNIATMV